ncbi:unnamed protein product [Linum tenue]|uniref:Uncharacterized protein n=2 Tax=Linum tenue TaxID=586396 RepID=A0AAV0KTW6_9ROSI|nr:unnamed protein product [Linum tenue]
MIFLLLLVSPLNIIIMISLSSNAVADAAVWGGCQGNLGECRGSIVFVYEEAEDFIGRRILQQAGGAGFISYDALKRNTVPCSMRGASYYNCQAGAEANPYTRGCSAITRCRS